MVTLSFPWQEKANVCCRETLVAQGGRVVSWQRFRMMRERGNILPRDADLTARDAS